MFRFFARLAVRRPVLTSMLVVILVILGGYSYTNLGVDLMPGIDFPVVTIATVYPGAGPEEVEQQVTERVEAAVSTIANIESLSSFSRENVSIVVVEFDYEVDADLAFHRGVAAYADGRLDEARQSFEKALAEDPVDRESLRYLALVLLAQGDAARALELEDRALALDPGDREVTFERGVTLLELRRATEARAVFQQVLADDPDDPRAQFYAGVAAYRSLDLAAAIPHLDRASRLAVTDFSVFGEDVRSIGMMSDRLTKELLRDIITFGDDMKKMSEADKKVKKVMHECKEGTLHSGKGGPVVKSKKQAVAIALSEAGKSKKSGLMG